MNSPRDDIHAASPARAAALALSAVALVALGAACSDVRPGDERDQSPGYRAGTAEDDYLSNGERGNVFISEVNWAGSVRSGVRGLRKHDPDDIFIEFQNKHPRPIHMTGWQIVVRTGTGDPLRDAEFHRTDPPERIFVIPPRENGESIQPNAFVTVAAKRDGAFPNADYYIEDLALPDARWEITLKDLDDRLIEPAGAVSQDVFAGGYDLVTVRSMERIQLIFSNRGSSESSWHAYSYNVWDEQHAELTQHIDPAYREFTFASPGLANSPDYSGNTAGGDFQ